MIEELSNYFNDIILFYLIDFIGSCYFHILFLIAIIYILFFKNKIFMKLLNPGNNIDSTENDNDQNETGLILYNKKKRRKKKVLTETEKSDRTIKYALAIFSIIDIIIILNPITAKYFTKIVGSDEYHRLTWILPENIVIAYFLASLIANVGTRFKKILVTICVILMVAITGMCIYPLQTNSSNLYGIADDTFEIIDYVSKDENSYKKIVGPEEIIVYSRQYDANIILACSRSFNYDSYFYMSFDNVTKNKEKWAIKWCIDNQVDYLVLYNKDVENMDKYIEENNVENIQKVYTGNSYTIYFINISL